MINYREFPLVDGQVLTFGCDLRELVLIGELSTG